jgi:hypothetical protein
MVLGLPYEPFELVLGVWLLGSLDDPVKDWYDR